MGEHASQMESTMKPLVATLIEDVKVQLNGPDLSCLHKIQSYHSMFLNQNSHVNKIFKETSDWKNSDLDGARTKIVYS